MKVAGWCGLAVVVCLASPVVAAERAAPETLFPSQAEIVAQGSGLVRLELGPEVLSRCRADLSDLRVFDDAGRVVPHLVDSRPPAELEIVQRVEARVVDVRRAVTGDRPPTSEERYTLQVPALPTDAVRWELVVSSALEEFVREVEVRTTDGMGGGGAIIERGSLFRISSPKAERLRVDLGAIAGAVEVRLRGQGESFLEPGLAFEATRQIAGPPPTEVGLEMLEIERRPRRTIVELARPRGVVPTRLRLVTSTGAFNREVTVWDEGAGAEATPIGRATLFRIEAVAPVEGTELALAAPAGDRLRVVIEDRDSPPLDEPRFVAVVTRPVLYFALPEGTTTALLRFGGGRARRPDYDLEGLAPGLDAWLAGTAAGRALAFRDPGRSRPATLGPIVTNPGYERSPALAFAMHPGAPLELRPYSHRRLLEVEPSDEGLARLRLEPEDLAVVRPDLADLRVVDDDLQQWAFLLDHETATTWVAVTVTGPRRDDHRSIFELELPVQPMTVRELELDFAAEFFDRAVELRGTAADGTEVRLADGRMARQLGDPRPLRFAVGGARLVALRLIVDDGDDAPLEPASAAVATPSPSLYLTAPVGRYTLLLGFPEAVPPRYELERARAVVLAVPSLAIAAGPLERNPEFSAASRLASGSRLQRTVMWLVLGLAVIGLAVLTLRLARQAEAG